MSWRDELFSESERALQNEVRRLRSAVRELEQENSDLKEKIAKYENLEKQLQLTYGECDGLLETAITGLVKHEGVAFSKPMKSRLLTDDDVDKWDRLKNAHNSKYFKNGELDDRKIAKNLHQLADDYENGELIEVSDGLIEIINAIDSFDFKEEQ
ncbi:MAG: hypothetical protein ACI4HI_18555 [Lachnospiraceae bacterium]